MNTRKRKNSSQNGQAQSEIALILALICIVAVVSLAGLRSQVWCSFARTALEMTRAIVGDSTASIDVDGDGSAGAVDLLRITRCQPR